MHRCSLALVSLLATSVLASPTLAQEDNQALDEAARLTFESAREAFVAGDYEVALARFRQAYQLSSRPGLLYNIAQTLDRLRRDEETVAALRDYLEASPGAPNRPEVEARIRVLEDALARRASNAPPPDPDPDTGNGSVGTGSQTPPLPASDPLAILHPGVFIAMAVMAVGSAAVLGWAGSETISLNDAYLLSTTTQDAEPLYDRANTMQLVTNIMIGTTALFGAAAIVTAILTDWGAFSGDSASLELRPVFAATGEGAFVGLGGQF